MQLCANDMLHLAGVKRKWLPAETWAAVLTLSHLVEENLCSVDAQKFNAAIIRSKAPLDGSSMDRFEGENNSGVFRGKFQNILYYMVSASFEQAEYLRPL